MKRDDIIVCLRRFKALKGEEYRIRRIGFFGSAASDRMRGKSDIDVVLELETRDLFSLIGIKQDLEKEMQGQVDVVSYRDTMNEFLRSRIDKDAVNV